MKMRAGCLGKPFLCTLAHVSSVSSYSAYRFPRHGALGSKTSMISSLHTPVPFRIFGLGIVPTQGLIDMNADPVMLCDLNKLEWSHL